MKIVKKGWKVDLGRVDEGYLYSEQTCTAETRNKAKNILLTRCYDMCLLDSPLKEVSYLTLPVIRCKEVDILEVDGEEMTRYQYERRGIRAERLAKFKKMEEDGYLWCFILKRGQYYRENCVGYTDFKLEAGIYDIKDGIRQAMSCDDLHLVALDITEYTEVMSKKIIEYSKKLALVNPSLGLLLNISDF